MDAYGGSMNLADLIDQLDQRYGNPHAKECALIQEAIKVLREMPAVNKEDGLVCAKCYEKIGA
jgi:hypothetical protein